MITKEIWKELVSKPKHLTSLAVFIAHENEPVTLTTMSSVLGCSKQYSQKIVYQLQFILKSKGVVCNFESTRNGFVFTFSKPEKKKVKVESNEGIIDETKLKVGQIIDYLNHKTNKRYTSTNKATIKDIEARLKEGYSLEDFKYVIDIKTEKWMNTQMEDYLRPQTLFGNKFNSYINERPNKQVSKIESAINETTRDFDWGLG